MLSILVCQINKPNPLNANTTTGCPEKIVTFSKKKIRVKSFSDTVYIVAVITDDLTFTYSFLSLLKHWVYLQFYPAGSHVHSDRTVAISADWKWRKCGANCPTAPRWQNSPGGQMDIFGKELIFWNQKIFKILAQVKWNSIYKIWVLFNFQNLF